MFGYLLKTERWMALFGFIVWAGLSTSAMIFGWGQIFAALGAFALALGFAIFLTDRFSLAEEKRYWDSLVETQMRQTWRYLKRARREDPTDPRDLDALEAQIDESFESLLSAKAAERGLENYRLEMGFSILGTLQWGFGAILVEALHPVAAAAFTLP
ncbi:MAG: hypothetical protein AAFW69_10155 [Pseudomonadota bacterium]